MSHVADTVLWTFLDADESVAPIQQWLDEHGYGQLVEVSGNAGGTKAFQGQLWVGAFNYLTVGEFLAVVFAQQWEYPECVTVSIKNEHDDWPTLYRGPLPAGVDGDALPINSND
jgi:hypothetical protein